MKGGPSNSSVASSNKTASSWNSQLSTSDARRVQSSLSSIRRKVKSFKKKHLVAKSKHDQTATTDCVACLEDEVLAQWRLESGELKTYEQFLRLTLRKPLTDSTVSSNAFIDLLGLSEKAQDFERLIVNESKMRITFLMETRLMKTFASLKEEGDGDDLKCVSEYDALVQNYKSDLENYYASFENNLASYEELSRPFIEYVRNNGDSISFAMSQVCNDLLSICKLVEAWNADDEAYPGKLEEEVNKNTSRKEELLQRLQQENQRKEANKTEIDRLRKVEERILRHYYINRREKRKLKCRLADLEERKVLLENKVSKSRQAKESLRQEIADKSPMTAREQYALTVKTGEIERTHNKLVDQSRLTDKQLKRVTRDLRPAMHTTYEHKVEAVTLRHTKENLEKENTAIDEEAKAAQQQLHQLDQHNARMVKIREMKMSGEAFRKNIRQQHRKELAYSNGSHDLAEACKAAAPSIGKDWKKVYLCLPFDPPRDAERLNRDVDILDHIAARNDVTDDLQALKSLEKWQTFNRKCDVMELIQALRQAKKKRLARDLQNRFVGVPV